MLVVVDVVIEGHVTHLVNLDGILVSNTDICFCTISSQPHFCNILYFPAILSFALA